MQCLGGNRIHFDWISVVALEVIEVKYIICSPVKAVDPSTKRESRFEYFLSLFVI